MALKPVLKTKVDELFLRWISEPETQTMLRENLRQLLMGEPLTSTSGYSARANKGQGARLRPASPPQSSSKLPSPRSPRRPLSTKNNHRGLNGNSKVSYPISFRLLAESQQRFRNGVVLVACMSISLFSWLHNKVCICG